MYVFLLMFSHVPFHLELFSTKVTGIPLYTFFFMVKRHLKHINVKCVRNISRETIESQNTCMGFNNHAQRFTPPYYMDVDNPLRNKVHFTGPLFTDQRVTLVQCNVEFKNPAYGRHQISRPMQIVAPIPQ